MTDIAMCQKSECKAKLECYRYLALPDPVAQPYSTHGREDNEKCESFIQVEKGYRLCPKKYQEKLRAKRNKS